LKFTLKHKAYQINLVFHLQLLGVFYQLGDGYPLQ